MVHVPVGFAVWLTAISMWFTPVNAPRRERLEGEHRDEEALRRRVVQAARVGHELGPDARRPVDRGCVAEERVEVDRVVHVRREA